MRWLSHPATVAAVGVLAVLAATGVTLASEHGTGGSTSNAAVCESLAVPAYFSPPYWETVIHSKYPPADIILNVTGVGAGTAPDAQLQALVSQARDAGITVLGYSSTADGQRPAAQVEADVRHYAAWYGVTSIFLDRVSGKPAQLDYYRQLADYIHQAHRGAQVWLNPGVYPDQSYMSVGDVVMVFEGTYAQYVTDSVPGWVSQYPAGRFADTIYATPGAALGDTLRMARNRNAGHVYVTDLVGSNPYQGLPSYWRAEDTDAVAGCGAGAKQAAPNGKESAECAFRTFGQSDEYQSCVYDLQVLLNDLWSEGLPGPDQRLVTDGYYGPDTESDVAAYNDAVDVSPTPGGVTTPSTWHWLCLQDYDRGFHGADWNAAGCASVV